MCTEEQHQEKLTLLHSINAKLNAIESHPAIDATLLISSNQPYVIDFRGRKHLFMWSPNDLTFSVEDIGQLTVSKNTWVNVGYQQGMRLVPAAQSTTVPVFVRATDETIP